MNVQCQKAINNVFSNHLMYAYIMYNLNIIQYNYRNLLGNLDTFLDTPLQALAEA